MVKRILYTLALLQLILSAYPGTGARAEYNPFTNVQNGRDLIRQANQGRYPVELRHFTARTPAEFDTISHIRVFRHTVYADWTNTFRMGHYIRQPLEKVKKEFENSSIKLEIQYSITKNVAEYGLIYGQSIRPGAIVTAKSLQIKTKKMEFHFSRPSLITGGSHEKNPYTRSTTSYAPRSFYYNGNGDVVLKLKVFTMLPVKMIDLTGLTFSEAKSRLISIGMPVGYIQDTYEKTYQASLYGKIFKQSIKPGTLLTRPRIMGVMIYAFPETKMPDLTNGWTLAKARQATSLSVVARYIKTGDISKDGIIVGQNVRAGTPLIKKTSVVVKTYKYEDPFYAPDYIGVDQDKAIKKLNEKHLRYRIEIKDIFDHFKSTSMDQETIRKNDGKVVAAKRISGQVVLTVIRFTPKSDTMPDLIGKDCPTAIKELIKLKKSIPGLTYTSEYISTKLFVNSGKVIKSEPAAFSEIKSYVKIKIY